MLRFAIITVSDRSFQKQRADLSGPALEKEVERLGWVVSHTMIVPDEVQDIQNAILSAVNAKVNVILTTGGTGFSPRDVTPEATLGIIERQAPGIAEGMRLESLKKTPHAMLSRGIAGIRGQTIIINLPGNPNAALENFQVIVPILPHAVELLTDSPNAELGHKKAS